MTERVSTSNNRTGQRIDAKDGHAINLALLTGDMSALFLLLADYLAANQLTMPAESVAMFAERDLFEQQ